MATAIFTVQTRQFIRFSMNPLNGTKLLGKIRQCLRSIKFDRQCQSERNLPQVIQSIPLEGAQQCQIERKQCQPQFEAIFLRDIRLAKIICNRRILAPKCIRHAIIPMHQIGHPIQMDKQRQCIGLRLFIKIKCRPICIICINIASKPIGQME